MEIPINLRNGLDNLIEIANIKEVRIATENVSMRYRDEKRDNSKLITTQNDAIAYSLYRMPATYSAVYTALKYVMQLTDLNCKTLIDVGAGTGAATWAVNELLEIEKSICIEKDMLMSDVGKALAKYEKNEIVWQQKNVIDEDIEEGADIVISAYMLNEISKDKQIAVVEKMWKATKNLLLIVDIGTKMRTRRNNANS